jgi:protein transport protein SEC31
VWDLRQKRSIITIRNSARMNVRTSGLAWNPSAGVQLAVCYSNYPVAEIWDLRQSMTPKVKLENFHTGSILALDWCPSDPSVLLTVGEDARMASWNPSTGAFLYEYQTSNVAFDIQWSPKLPNIISTCSYDGKVNIESINTTGPHHVPAWMGKPTGGSFGFGGKLVSWGFDAPPVQPPTGTGAPVMPPRVQPRIQIQQLVTDPEVLDKAAGLQQILKEGNFPNFCAYKIAHAGGDEGEKTIWTFMKILFEDEQNQRYLLLKELGFEPPATSDIVMPQPSVPVIPDISAEDFFNSQQFPSPEPEKPAEGALENTTALSQALDGVEGKEDGATSTSAGAPALSPSKPFVEDADDKAIRQALVFGDFKAAVAKCLQSNRMADAIVFASFGPPQLWEETRAVYFEKHRMPFIRNIMKNVSNQTLDAMIKESDLANWKETLAICITYTATDKYRQLVNLLGQRLEEAGKNIPAVVCYICSSNIDKAVSKQAK